MDESSPGTSKPNIDLTDTVLTTRTHTSPETTSDDSGIEISKTVVAQDMHTNVTQPELHENDNEYKDNEVEPQVDFQGGPSMNISASGLQSQAALNITNNYHMYRQTSETDSEDDIRDNIAVKLKNMCKNLKMRRGPWFPDELLPEEDLYSELEIASKKNKHPILLEELFETIEGEEKPSRILIEGRAGIGKTTIALKLAADWASGKKYIQEKFKLVFLVPLKHFNYDDIDNVLVDLGKQSDVSNSTLLAKIKQRPEDVLLVLDGYDELKTEKQTCFQSLLCCEKYPKMTVVLTTRTNELSRNSNNSATCLRLQIFPGALEFWSKKIQISGLKPDKRLDLLKNILTQDEFNNNEEKIMRMLHDLDELFTCPLYLFMLARIIKKSPVHIKTKTQLFISFFGLLISRSLERPDTVDLLHVLKRNSQAWCSDDGEVNEIVRMFTELGKLSLQKAKGGSTKYSEEEIKRIESEYKPDFLTNLGILTTIFDDYEVTHYLLVEFLIACHLFTFFDLAKSQFRKEVPWLQAFVFVKNDKSMVLPFLAGLLQNKCYMLFEALRPFAYEYCACPSYLASLLVECDISVVECDISDTLMTSLTPFIPTLWLMPCSDNDSGFASTAIHKKVVEHGLAENKIKVLSWKLNSKVSVCENISVDQLHIIVSGSVLENDVNIPVVKCTDLKVIVDEFNMKGNTWDILIKCICQMDAQNLSIHILDSAEEWLPAFHHEIFKGMLRSYSFGWIRCCLRARKMHLMPLVRDLICNEKKTGMELIFDKSTSNLLKSESLCPQAGRSCTDNKCDNVEPKQLQKIMESISKSPSILNVHLRDRERLVLYHSEDEEEQKWLDVDLDYVHLKKWNWVRFWTISLNNSQKISFSIRQLDLVDVQCNAELITGLHLEELRCLSMDSEFFSESSLTEQQCKFENLEVLDVVLNQKCDWEPVINSLQYFQRISTLALTLPLRNMTEHMNEIDTEIQKTTDGNVENTVEHFAECLWTLQNLQILQFFGTNRSPELLLNIMTALRHKAKKKQKFTGFDTLFSSQFLPRK